MCELFVIVYDCLAGKVVLRRVCRGEGSDGPEGRGMVLFVCVSRRWMWRGRRVRRERERERESSDSFHNQDFYFTYIYLHFRIIDFYELTKTKVQMFVNHK